VASVPAPGGGIDLDEAAVLTGALAVGQQAALDNVFTKRLALSA
jgi:hypothetical protein